MEIEHSLVTWNIVTKVFGSEIQLNALFCEFSGGIWCINKLYSIEKIKSHQWMLKNAQKYDKNHLEKPKYVGDINSPGL